MRKSDCKNLPKPLRKFANSALEYLHHDEDILSQRTKEAVLALVQKALDNPQIEAASLENEYDVLIPRKSYAKLREWLDIIAVAMAVAMGIRGLFFQPFKIPTGSMQPTLFGFHYVKNGAVPGMGATGLTDALLFNAARANLTVKSPGALTAARQLGDRVEFKIGDQVYQVPGDGNKLVDFMTITPGRHYQTGDVLVDGFWVGGDHLFVDRLTHHFRDLRRGDVVVFATDGLQPTSGAYYIKRLVGLPGDTLKISQNQLYVKVAGQKQFQKIQDLEPERFGKLYSGLGGYQGHDNYSGPYGRFLLSKYDEFVVPIDQYFMLGDNTHFSSDSRVFGTVPRANIVGLAMNVFWPLSRRWGQVGVNAPVEQATGEKLQTTYQEMFLQ